MLVSGFLLRSSIFIGSVTLFSLFPYLSPLLNDVSLSQRLSPETLYVSGEGSEALLFASSAIIVNSLRLGTVCYSILSTLPTF